MPNTVKLSIYSQENAGFRENPDKNQYFSSALGHYKSIGKTCYFAMPLGNFVGKAGPPPMPPGTVRRADRARVQFT